MSNHAEMLATELLGEPTATMRQYLAHFQRQADEFVRRLAHAANAWEQFSIDAVKREAAQEEMVWSAAYFINAINATLISTRLFLCGYIVPSTSLLDDTIGNPWTEIPRPELLHLPHHA